MATVWESMEAMQDPQPSDFMASSPWQLPLWEDTTNIGGLTIQYSFGDNSVEIEETNRAVNVALKIYNAEREDAERHPRARLGPKIVPDWGYWVKLARAYLWMVDNKITHWTERVRA